MIGRLLLTVLVMWRLCAPQTAFAVAESVIRLPAAVTKVATADYAKQAPVTVLEEEEEEVDESELDDAGLAQEILATPVILLPFWAQGPPSQAPPVRLAKAPFAGLVQSLGQAPLYVLHAQFRL